jgi:hypothetical protein
VSRGFVCVPGLKALHLTLIDGGFLPTLTYTSLVLFLECLPQSFSTTSEPSPRSDKCGSSTHKSTPSLSSLGVAFIALVIAAMFGVLIPMLPGGC